MSTEPTSHDHAAHHEGPIKTWQQLMVVVVLSFVVPVITIMMLANYVSSQTKPAEGSDSFKPEAVAQRIQPVGRVEVKDSSDPAQLKNGEQVYAAQCAACHAAGVAGAPKTGDTAAWGPRLGGGYEALLASVLKGKGSMPPQGGGDFSEFEIGRAVVHLANLSGGKLPEPKAPAR